MLLLFVPAIGFGQNCESKEQHQFDFWIGDWQVYNDAGKLLGYNTIKKLQGGCVLQENWRGAAGTYTGSSYNHYDKKDSLWHQTWVDNNGAALYLYGGIDEKGQMVLYSGMQTAQKGTKYYNRVTWTPNSDGSVRQKWDVLTDSDQLIQVAFNGIYKRKEGATIGKP